MKSSSVWGALIDFDLVLKMGDSTIDLGIKKGSKFSVTLVDGGKQDMLVFDREDLTPVQSKNKLTTPTDIDYLGGTPVGQITELNASGNTLVHIPRNSGIFHWMHETGIIEEVRQ